MAASQAETGFGADLLKATTSEGTTYVSMGLEITNISWGGVTRATDDASHMASPNQAREFIEGMIDAGDISLDGAYIPTADASDAAYEALKGGKWNYQIMFQNGVKFNFTGILTSYSPTVPMEGKSTASISIKISGLPVFEAAS